MRSPTLLLVLSLSVLAGCTSSDPESSVVEDELLRPESPRVLRDGLQAEQGDPSRTGSCPQLSGQALRDCMERAQYQPEGSQGLPSEPQTRRPDPNHELPDRDGRPPRTDAQDDAARR